VFHKTLKWPPKAGALIDDEVTFIADAFFNDSMGIGRFTS
jgi:hypothetical protein